MIAIMVLVMVVGTAMDMTPTILILTPVLMPIVKAAGIDPVYFGVLFIINNAIGLITPPVGTVLNVVAGVGKMSMDEVTGRGAFHDRAVRRDVPDGAVPAAGDGAGALVLRLILPKLSQGDIDMKRLILKTLVAAAALAAFGIGAQAQGAHASSSPTRTKGHPHRMGMEKFAELVAAKSGGKIKVKLFPAARSAATRPTCRRCRAARWRWRC
jgi:hypothetical protein